MKENDQEKKSILKKIVQLNITTINLLKLTLLNKFITASSVMIFKLAIIISLLIFNHILFIGLAFEIGEYLGKLSLGFYIVALIYLLFKIVIFVFFHKWIKHQIKNIIVYILLE
jgi:hypothetical protein